MDFLPALNFPPGYPRRAVQPEAPACEWDDETLKRLVFAKYMVLTQRLNERDDRDDR